MLLSSVLVLCLSFSRLPEVQILSMNGSLSSRSIDENVIVVGRFS